MKTQEPKRQIDWEGVEIHYRAGIRTLKDIATEYGISDAGILKRAKTKGWVRDLAAKIRAKAEAKVSAAAVSELVSEQKSANESAIVEANAEIISRADLLNRDDVVLALKTSRSQLAELSLMCDAEFKDKLEALGDICDQSYVNDAGTEVKDKANEMYRYIISLPGRAKIAKDISASLVQYIQMQRKILKLDDEADANQGALDQFLAKINAFAE